MKKQNTKKTTHFVIPTRIQVVKANGKNGWGGTFCICACIAPQE